MGIAMSGVGTGLFSAPTNPAGPWATRSGEILLNPIRCGAKKTPVQKKPQEVQRKVATQQGSHDRSPDPSATLTTSVHTLTLHATAPKQHDRLQTLFFPLQTKAQADCLALYNEFIVSPFKEEFPEEKLFCEPSALWQRQQQQQQQH
jgi:hypothetical protein